MSGGPRFTFGPARSGSMRRSANTSSPLVSSDHCTEAHQLSHWETMAWNCSRSWSGAVEATSCIASSITPLAWNASQTRIQWSVRNWRSWFGKDPLTM